MSNITFKYKAVKIKKPRHCESCFRRFEPGVKMVYWAGLTEGDFGSVYICETCSILYNKFNDPNDYAPFNDFHGNIKEKGETPEQTLKRMLNEPAF